MLSRAVVVDVAVVLVFGIVNLDVSLVVFPCWLCSQQRVRL